MICVHFLGLGQVKNLPGPVAGEKTDFHPALTAVGSLLVLGSVAIILVVVWKKCGKDCIQTAHDAYCIINVVLFQ